MKKLLGVVLAASLVLVGCGSKDSLEGKSDSADSNKTITVGSQDYYSNEIIAELYAGAIEAKGHKVERDMRIGQREVYMPEISAGKIDVFPEYTGNLLQYVKPEAKETEADAVYTDLQGSVPSGTKVLDQAQAADQDSYVVTKQFAEQHNLKSIADLANVEGLVLGGNSELETRPYGPKGLKDVYGVEVNFTPVEDSGGPLTLKALRDGKANIVDIYSADPALASDDLVVLQDPKSLFLASRVVPLVSDKLDPQVSDAINAVQAKLTADDLIELNRQSTQDQKTAADIASAWLKEKNLA